MIAFIRDVARLLRGAADDRKCLGFDSDLINRQSGSEHLSRIGAI